MTVVFIMFDLLKFLFWPNFQVPHLDQWCDLEGDHSSSLIGLTSALYNSSLRLPVIGNVRVWFHFNHVQCYINYESNAD